MHQEPRLTSSSKGLLSLLAGRERYLNVAVEHGLAVDLEKKQFKDAFTAGTYPSSVQLGSTRAYCSLGIEQVIKDLGHALLWTVGALAIGLIVAALCGSISFTLPPSPSKIFSCIGGVLAAWSTLYELGGSMVTYSGRSLHEMLHKFIFKLLFIPGVVLSFIGALL
jgi:hypothetical protein